MNTNEIITPDIVRRVLGIEPKGIIEMTEKFIIFYGDDGYCGNWNIHEFIYLAIEKCAAEGYSVTIKLIPNINDGIVIIGRHEEHWGSGYPHRDMLHAQLAAIAWVYGKMQEGK